MGKLMEMPFSKRLKVKIICSALFILLGAGAVSLSLVAENTDLLYLYPFARGFYLGTGLGLIGAGISTIVISVYTLKSPQRMKEKQTAMFDERNRYLRQRTWAVTGYLFLCLLYVAAMFIGFVDVIVAQTLLAVMLCFAVLLFVVRIVIGKLA
ncbi:hypothetical protein [Youxingia wuxianensis]|uniref:DUF2178 domain-containing protein n=1 Tax=Youxingia wuxianensis TaxID=2763678 RepID=A0A926IGA9_9FIRM|nr:hypothetical protein [Youxingia wuxianensis]MBC8584041.1 hypothetical protein [Youxingia wuxianensis]